MDVDRIPKAQQPQPVMMMAPIQVQQQFVQGNVHYGQPLNTYESMEMESGSCRF